MLKQKIKKMLSILISKKSFVKTCMDVTVLFIMHQRVELLSVSAVYFYNISVM